MKAFLNRYRFILTFSLVAIMASWNLVAMRSLWLDEAMLSINFLERSLLGLLEPLGYNQVAPIGFLVLEKLSGMLCGYSNLSLRIVPFLGFLIGWIGLYGGLRETLGQRKGWPELVGLLIGAAFRPLDYAIEVKQYTFDAMVWAWAFWGIAALISGKLSVRRLRDMALIASMGVVMLCFSNVAVLVLFGFGVAWLAQLILLKSWAEIRPAIGTMAIWVLAFILYYFAFLHNHPSKDFMIQFWSAEDAFMPLDGRIWAWVPMAFNRFFHFLLKFHFWGFRHLYIFVLLAVWGWFRVKRNSAMALFFLVPLSMHLVLSGLQIYPFQGRLAMWHFPGIAIGFAAWLSSIDQTHRHPLPSLALVLCVCLNFAHTLSRMPSTRRDLQPILDHLRAESGPHQTLFHDNFAHPVLRFEETRNPGLPDFSDAKIGTSKVAEVPLEILNSATDTAYYLAYVMTPHLEDSVRLGCLERGRTFELVVDHAGSQLYRTVNKH